MTYNRAKGDCYEAHVRFLREQVEEEEQDDWTLCHGTVANASGEPIEHCWLEANGYAYDFSNGNYFALPADRYRELTKATNVIAYTSNEVSFNIIRHGHYGPWTSAADSPD
jgi:hypothetical protein